MTEAYVNFMNTTASASSAEAFFACANHFAGSVIIILGAILLASIFVALTSLTSIILVILVLIAVLLTINVYMRCLRRRHN